MMDARQQHLGMTKSKEALCAMPFALCVEKSLDSFSQIFIL